MAGSKALKFFILVSFVISLTLALEVVLTDGKGRCNYINGFTYETGIKYHGKGEMAVYDGRVINNTYWAGPTTTKLIVYITSYAKLSRKILRIQCGATRVKISDKLREYGYELLYLGVKRFIQEEQHLIAEFLLQTIQSDHPNFRINTIGEKKSDMYYGTPTQELHIYDEERRIFGGNLLGELQSMDK